jgi:predicted transcriptional regulator of viral defense system
MPCVRLTIDQARAFFGLTDHAASRALLEQLAEEGFLARTDEGEYVRRIAQP